LAIAVIGGILISMILSLVITPAVHFYLSHEDTKLEEVEAVQPSGLRFGCGFLVQIGRFPHCAELVCRTLQKNLL
jgi:hypothetical protein